MSFVLLSQMHNSSLRVYQRYLSRRELTDTKRLKKQSYDEHGVGWVTFEVYLLAKCTFIFMKILWMISNDYTLTAWIWQVTAQINSRCSLLRHHKWKSQPKLKNYILVIVQAPLSQSNNNAAVKFCECIVQWVYVLYIVYICGCLKQCILIKK